MAFSIQSIAGWLKSINGRLIAIVITSVYIAALLLIQSDSLESPDPIPIVKKLSAVEKKYSSHIKVGLHINSFPKFSFNENNFIIDGILWFKFPSGSESIKTLETFSFNNAITNPGAQLVYKSLPIIKLIGNDVLLSYHVQVNFKANLNHKNFPIGKHRLTIMLQNKETTPYEIYFESDKDFLSISEQNLLDDWAPIDKTVQCGYVRSELYPKDPALNISYPVVAFSINFINLGIRDLISLYFPMFVIFIIALFCLLIDIKDTARFGYVAATIPLLVLFRMVIDQVSPQAGYTTHLDYVYNLLVFLSLGILIFHAYVILRLQAIKEHPAGVKERMFTRLELYNHLVFYSVLFLLAIFLSISFLR
jgi:hypothetical protein